MKRLDKPTKHGDDNLLNFQKKSDIPVKTLLQSKLSGCLESKTNFLCLPVSISQKSVFLVNQIFHIHLKPSVTRKTVEGEV
jgi:hypothetical protein